MPPIEHQAKISKMQSYVIQLGCVAGIGPRRIKSSKHMQNTPAAKP
jgi:hypothetical protein